MHLRDTAIQYFLMFILLLAPASKAAIAAPVIVDLLTRPLNTVRLYDLESTEFIEGSTSLGFDELVW
ncbi:hypothetical protein [Methylomonas sp. 11b]|uniref:hypothetical protein n=1 Tax=Methylomonas sp. 11b TaxID=1168169 RepID=UPI00047DC347|nr:hypothetical protein [Methylomonas sp. 11b]